MILRMGAFDYEPLPEVKELTFDEKFRAKFQDEQQQKSQNIKEDTAKYKISITRTLSKMIREGLELKEKERFLTCTKSLFSDH